MKSIEVIKRSLILAGLLAAVLSAGTITGTIKFEGKVPKLKKIKMSADPICQATHKKTVRSEALVLGKGNTVGNVFVKIKSGLKKKKYPKLENWVSSQTIEHCDSSKGRRKRD